MDSDNLDHGAMWSSFSAAICKDLHILLLREPRYIAESRYKNGPRSILLHYHIRSWELSSCRSKMAEKPNSAAIAFDKVFHEIYSPKEKIIIL
jgi:hypothetical protein